MEWRRIEEKWMEMTVRLQAIPQKTATQTKPGNALKPVAEQPADSAPAFDTTNTRAMA